MTAPPSAAPARPSTPLGGGVAGALFELLFSKLRTVPNTGPPPPPVVPAARRRRGRRRRPSAAAGAADTQRLHRVSEICFRKALPPENCLGRYTPPRTTFSRSQQMRKSPNQGDVKYGRVWLLMSLRLQRAWCIYLGVSPRRGVGPREGGMILHA